MGGTGREGEGEGGGVKGEEMWKEIKEEEEEMEEVGRT